MADNGTHAARVAQAQVMGLAPPAPTDEPHDDLTVQDVTDVLLWLVSKTGQWNDLAAFLKRPAKAEALRLRLTRARRNEDARILEGPENIRRERDRRGA
jgi:hypothetical protein